MKNKTQNKQNTGIMFVLTGFGLGDIFNFGFYILPGILHKYKNMHIVTNHTENIFKYESGVIWHFLPNDHINTLIDRVLKKYQGEINEVVYLDNHKEFLSVLKKITTRYNIQLFYPSRMFIDKTIHTEKGFYFNIYIKMIRFFNLFIPKIDKLIQLYGKNEKQVYHKYFIKHTISASTGILCL